ncbi:hypothetical protein CTA1_5542 [Colletotrichum tanaceti]|uniref:Uncharacterized protein n=1 Tax=Colletotrichum tanaceti TaxID=1306861 RepID=A0A4V6DFY8_9PEZI|nr:hypothetical protein CTA1_5542 [Colletotrichum tanaceti]
MVGYDKWRRSPTDAQRNPFLPMCRPTYNTVDMENFRENFGNKEVWPDGARRGGFWEPFSPPPIYSSLDFFFFFFFSPSAFSGSAAAAPTSDSRLRFFSLSFLSFFSFLSLDFSFFSFLTAGATASTISASSSVTSPSTCSRTEALGRSVRRGTYHDIGVLGGLLAGGVELEAVLDLLAQSLTELGGGVLGVVVDTGGDGALVGQVAGDAALVLDGGLADEAGVVDETVLGGVALGLEGAEEGLLGAEDLERRGRGAGVRDELSGDGGADKGLQVGRDDGHLLVEVVGGRAAGLGLGDDGLGEALDDLEVGGHDGQAHGDLGGVDDGLGLLAILLDEGGDVVQAVVGEGGLVADGEHELGVGQVVRDNLDELGEVPAVPLAHAHEELVDALVLELDGGAGLDDVVVVLGGAELHLGARVRVAQTEAGGGRVARLQALEEAVGMQADAAEEVAGGLGGLGGFAVDTGEGGLDHGGQILFGHRDGDSALLAARLGEVELKDRLEVVRHETLRDVVDLVQRLLSGAVREETRFSRNRRATRTAVAAANTTTTNTTTNQQQNNSRNG